MIETDGKLMSGRDVAIAAFWGREFGFATGASGNHGLCDDAGLQPGYLSGGRGEPRIRNFGKDLPGNRSMW